MDHRGLSHSPSAVFLPPLQRSRASRPCRRLFLYLRSILSIHVNVELRSSVVQQSTRQKNEEERSNPISAIARDASVRSYARFEPPSDTLLPRQHIITVTLHDCRTTPAQAQSNILILTSFRIDTRLSLARSPRQQLQGPQPCTHNTSAHTLCWCWW